ncbi:hypothetical protein FRC01_014337, partial [Tulasnella sp. 417]
ITSHSQDFMDSICTNIMELTPKKKMVYYSGNYTTFVRTKSENEVNQMKAYHKQQEEIAHIKKFIASAGTYANLVKQAKSKQKIIDKMEAAGLIEKVEVPRPLRFNFEDIQKLPPPIIAFNEVAFSYSGKQEDYLYQKLSFGIDMDSRIAILGANGTGKSTLLHLITGALQPCEGTISKHINLKLAKYSQHSADQLPYDLSPIEYFQKLYSEKYPEKDIQAWRQQIGRFGLSGNHQTSPIKQLSDGLRNRVVFSQLAMEHPHILLLDEPTNHLDMMSIDALASAIKEFEGGVVIVSHDFRLISQVAEELWEVKNKKIRNLTKEDIDIKAYKSLLVKQISVWQMAEASTSAVAEPQAPPPRTVLYCQICSFPPEYCEFGSSASKCKVWLKDAHSELYEKYYGDDALQSKMQSLSVEAQAKLEKDTAKKEAKAEAKAKVEAEKKQASIELKKASRYLAQKFATGSSVTKNPQGQEEIVVQGDVSDEIFDIIDKASEGGGGQLGTLLKAVPIDNVVQTEEKMKK